MRGIAYKVRSALGHEFIGLFGNSAFVFFCAGSSAFFAFVTQVFLARWMGAPEFGLFVLANSLCVILAELAILGYPGTAYRFVGRGLASNDFQSIRGFVRRGNQIVIGSSVLVAIVGSSVWWLSRAVIPPDYVRPIILAFLCVPLLAVMRLHGSVANAFSWFALAHMPISVIRALLFLIAICAVWFLGGSLSASKAMLILLLVLFVILVGQWIIFSKNLNAVLGEVQPTYETRVWLRTAIPLLLIMLCTANFREVTVIIAAIFLSPEEVGLYTAAFRIAILIAFGLGSVDAVTMPRAARLYAEGKSEALQKLVTRATRLKFFGSAVALSALIILGRQILEIFGEQFAAGYHCLLILAFAQLLIGAAGPGAQLLIATGHQDRCLLVFGIGLVATVGLNWFLAPLFGIEGVALATLLATGIWVIWLQALVAEHIGIRPSIFYMGK